MKFRQFGGVKHGFAAKQGLLIQSDGLNLTRVITLIDFGMWENLITFVRSVGTKKWKCSFLAERMKLGLFCGW